MKKKVSFLSVFVALLTQPSTPVLAQGDQNADQVIIKELYNGGVMLDDGSKNFHFDKCIILYNNCPEQAIVSQLAIGTASPYNAEANSIDNLYSKGKLVYEADGFIPAENGIWYFPNTLTIDPFTEVVVNIHGAIDNTQTVSNSVNYANPDYYCMYDPTYSGGSDSEATLHYNNTSYYPAPAEVIPTSHYLKTVKYGMANAWPLSVTSPAVFIFQPQGEELVSYAENTDNMWYMPGYPQNFTWACLKVHSDWILDGLEVFSSNKLDVSKKRLTADIDGGYVTLTNQLGHSLYRNVDKEMTEARPENKGKLVYDYTLGGDPSGIDAEASMRNGAHIVFQDTNNSSADFHERQRCSLRDRETSAISTLDASTDQPQQVFTLDGKSVSPRGLSHGIYVVRTATGTYKVCK